MSDLLDPVPFPEGFGISAEDWPQTPTSVRGQFLSLLKRVDALEARFNQNSSHSSRPPATEPPRQSANDGRKLPSAVSLEPSVAILAIDRCSWNRPHRCPCDLLPVLVAIVGVRKSPCITRIRSLHYPSFALQ